MSSLHLYNLKVFLPSALWEENYSLQIIDDDSNDDSNCYHQETPLQHSSIAGASGTDHYYLSQESTESVAQVSTITVLIIAFTRH